MTSILIVDDEKLEREGIKRLIRRNNLPLHLAEAENAEVALKFMKSNTVDILLTDIRMPLMDGLELSQRALEVDPFLKVIIYSAYSEFEYAKKAIDIHVEGYLLKPIKVSDFLQVINRVIAVCEGTLNRRHHSEGDQTFLVKEDSLYISQSTRKVTSDVIRIIREKYMEEISLESLAKLVYLTPSYLSHLFKRETGEGLAKYITTYRLNEARKLLNSTNMKIADIGKAVGYGDLSYFCVLFKNNFGATPTQFREVKK